MGTVGKRLLLVNPLNPATAGLARTPISRFPPLSLGILAALTPEDWTIEIADENWVPFRHRDADLVGITAFTSSANRAYEIAAHYRNRGVPVVMGGVHASVCPEEAGQLVDAVVVGEAEPVWRDVLADAEAGRLKAVYRSGFPELAGLPRPRRELFDPSYAFTSVQTSRGCPMDCDFCSVHIFNGRRYRRRPAEEVLDEIQGIAQRRIFFVDDNIIGYGQQAREEALALFRGMVARKLRKRFVCQASLNFADDEVLRWAHRAGCKLVLLGLEAEETDALAETNKRLNLRLGVDTYAQIFRRIHRAGIAALGAFIFGMDSDTPEKLRRRVDYIVRNGVDAVQAAFLTPLPGTRLFQRLKDEGRLLYTSYPQDWNRYDLSDVVYRPLRMTAETLVDTMRNPVRHMYSLPVLAAKFLRTLWDTRDPASATIAWQANRSYRQVVCARYGFK